ncbi:MAG TPA: type II secretion system F family protein [Planctomycetota bacterium]|jgi:type IV pilus assembly protein PilC|nr:type II secretion system F family protein [Planctomycetota bacterium]
MSHFRYAAKDEQGKTVSGTIAARDRGEVVAELRRRRLTILDVQAVAGAGRPAGAPRRARRPGGKAQEVVLFTRQLATMISAGIPLLEALEILESQAETPAFRATTARLVEEVRTGKDFSKALEACPRAFPNLYMSMVRAGEISGQLDVILVRLAEYLEATAALKREIRAAMTYPAISMVLVVGIASFLMIGIVPQFKPVFDALEVKLPGLTTFVMDTAFWFKRNAILVFGGLGAAICGLVAFRRTETGQELTDRVVLRLPVFGPLFQKVALSRFSRTFSTLVRSGVPILAAMEIVAETSGNRVVAAAVLRARESVRGGDTLSAPLADAAVFPPMVTKMIGIGERSGALETLLEKVAVFYDQQVAAEVKSLTSMLEPLLIGVMGFLVGTIVLAVFLPIFKLQESLAKMH